MAETLDPKEVVTREELFMNNRCDQETLINELKIGNISKEEVREEIKRLSVQGAKTKGGE